MTVALSFIDVRKSFGATEILRGIDLDIREGEIVAIIGPNGAGKSTLFDLATGRAGSSGGRIELYGKRIDGRRSFQIARQGLSRSFQTTRLFGAMTCADNLRAAMLWNSGHRYSFWTRLRGLGAIDTAVSGWLEQLGLSELAGVMPSSLNYAQQRALELGLALAGGSKTVLLDEPTAGMNREESRRLTGLIRSVASNRTLVIVEHDMDVVFELADRVAVLVDGRIIAFDTPVAVRLNPEVQRAYLGNSGNLDDRVQDLRAADKADVSTYAP